jgi:phosphoribosylanthranilate isomerase
VSGGGGEPIGAGVPFEVKICGVCRPEDAALVAEAGADYLGVILAPGGRRSRSPEEAAGIYAAAPGCARVGVFVDERPDRIRALAEALALDVVQLHGAEAPALLAELRGGGRPGEFRLWKALRPRNAAEFLDGIEAFGGEADAILLDGWSAVAPGGTGARAPWIELGTVRGRLPAGLELVLAGGLLPGNLAEATAPLAPRVVDVSSGVEGGDGWKDPALVREFVATAHGLWRGGRDGAI